MQLRPLEPQDIERVAGWLAQKENWQWLHFGAGVQRLSAVSLKLMAQRELHHLRLFSAADGAPIGLVALSDIDREFRTARLWYVLGEKRHAGQGHTRAAVARLLGEAFADLSLEAISAWAAEDNQPSIHVLLRNGFRLIGRQRRCHHVDGRPRDRLHFDLLRGEHLGAAG